jgi:hypothetical protein
MPKEELKLQDLTEFLDNHWVQYSNQMGNVGLVRMEVNLNHQFRVLVVVPKYDLDYRYTGPDAEEAINAFNNALWK